LKFKTISNLFLGSCLTALASNSTAVAYNPNDLAKEIVAEQLKLEMTLYSKVPDFIDCKKASYIKDCETVNFLLKKHPSAPIRVKSIDGVTHTFSNETPTSTLNAMLNPQNMKLAEEVDDYNKSVDRMVVDHAKTMMKYLESKNFSEKAGRSFNDLSENHDKIPDSEGEKLTITVFVSEMEKESRGYLYILKGLQKDNPKINFQILSVNSSEYWHDTNITKLGFTKSSTTTKRELSNLGINTIPSLFIKNKQTGNIYKSTGFMLETELLLRIKKALKDQKNED